jgi:hypothetical protein
MFELSHPYTIGLETADVMATTWHVARATYRPLGDVGAVGVTNKSTNTEKSPEKKMLVFKILTSEITVSPDFGSLYSSSHQFLFVTHNSGDLGLFNL